MKKKILTMIAAAAMTMAMSMTTFAAGWVQDSTGWWWDNSDGTWPVSEWRWLDGNTDGVAECYYFGEDGYLLTNTVTPDGYYVGGNGAWEENSIPKIKLVDVDPAVLEAKRITSDNSTATKSADEIIAYLTKRYDSSTLFVNDNGRAREYYPIGDRSGWQWFKFDSSTEDRTFPDIMCALAFDSDGYLMTNTTTPDGFQTNEYGQLVINGEVVEHTIFCYAANPVYGLYTDGTRFTDPNNVDVSRLDSSLAVSGYDNYHLRLFKFGSLRYNHVKWNDADGKIQWGLGYTTCVDDLRTYQEKMRNKTVPEGTVMLPVFRFNNH